MTYVVQSHIEKKLENENKLILSVNCHWVDIWDFCFIGSVNTNEWYDTPGIENAIAQKRGIVPSLMKLKIWYLE